MKIQKMSSKRAFETYGLHSDGPCCVAENGNQLVVIHPIEENHMVEVLEDGEQKLMKMFPEFQDAFDFVAALCA